jgi:hypothetical protein
MNQTDPWIDNLPDGTLQLMACQYASPGVTSQSDRFQWYPKGFDFTPSDDPTANLATAIRLLTWEIERQARKRANPKAAPLQLRLSLQTTEQLATEIDEKITTLQPLGIDGALYKCVEREHEYSVYRCNHCLTLHLADWKEPGDYHVGDRIEVEGHPYIVTRADPPDEVTAFDYIVATLDEAAQAPAGSPETPKSP